MTPITMTARYIRLQLVRDPFRLSESNGKGNQDMISSTHDEVRQLLKEFGVTADETIMAYVLEEKPVQPLRLRIRLEDLTQYERPPAQPLHLEVEGTVTPPPGVR